MSRITRILLAIALWLLAFSSDALAASETAWTVPTEPDARAIIGTIVIGVAGGLVLAILDGTGTRETKR